MGAMVELREMTREERLEWIREREAARISEIERDLKALWLERGPVSGGFLLEMGCGHGHWLAEYAAHHPETTCVGIDIRSRRVRKSMDKALRAGRDNLFFRKAEGREFLKGTPSGCRWDTVCMLFMDPWPKARHHKNRIIQLDFLDLLHAKTSPGARLYFRTDHKEFFEWTAGHIETHRCWQAEPDAPWLYEHPTYFQEKMDSWRSLVVRRMD